MANHAMCPYKDANGGQSPFDTIKHTREDGSEYWSARDLMPLMGYPRWNEFKVPLDRAMKSAEVQGQSIESNFRGSTKVKKPGSRGPAGMDFELSRFAAYLVAMNGDPNKPEVAASQAYFAIQTHVAETHPKIDGTELTRLELIQIAMNAETERLELEAKNKQLEPKAEAYDRFIDADGTYSIGNVAKMLGLSQNKLFAQLRNLGILIPKGHMRNTPYQRYMHYFSVKAYEYERSDGTIGSSYTTRVQPGGIRFIFKKLGKDHIDPVPEDISKTYLG